MIEHSDSTSHDGGWVPPYGVPLDGSNDTVPSSSVDVEKTVITVSKWYFDTGGNLRFEGDDEGALA